MAKKKNQNKKPQIEKRPPVIVVMGHIDHGKSTLLDYIRSANTTEGEAGGITQAISAYELERDHAGETKKITFIDTPGHEAFQSMRQNGANVADIAILVVAADDGVNEQTLEAHKAILQSEIPFCVALNKIDLANADANKAITSLIENEIYVEGYGGEIPINQISAKTGDGVEELLDTIHLMADLEELTADRNQLAEGYVLESNIDPQAGIAATLIIKDGTLRSSQGVTAGESLAPVRVMKDFTGKQIREASFSSPVQLIGFDQLPSVGQSFVAHENKKAALKYLAENETNNDIQYFDESLAENVIPLVVKSDSAGAIEAIKYEISKLDQERTEFKVIDTGTGNISESDIRSAGSQKNGLVVGFGVGIDNNAADLAERQQVKFNSFKIIYELIEYLENEQELRTPKRTVEKTIGKAKILKTFNRSKSKQIIGGKVVEGELNKGARVNIIRRDEVIGKGSIYGLQQSRSETDRVEEGFEFGCSLEAKLEVAPGDVIEAFQEVEE
jgi:translation initiation factor IF-2